MIDIDFREWLAELDLVEDATEPGTIQQATIDQSGPASYVWFNRRSSNTPLRLAGEQGALTESAYDVELVSDNINTAQDMAVLLKDELNGYRGQWGDSFIHGAFVEDHSDDYTPANGQDDGKHVCSLDVTIIHTDNEGD